MNLKEVANVGQALDVILNQPMKAKIAFRIACATKEFRKEYNLFIDTREKLVKKYGTPQESGMVRVAQENLFTFNEELTELVAEEVQVEPFRIKLADIEDLDLPAGVIALLEPYIEGNG